jgi:HD-like signal output (HDOD) protein
MALQREMHKDEPDLARVEKLVQRDAAITGHLLQTANSPFFRTTQRVRTIREALMRIGLNQCAAIMTGVLTKKAMSGTAMMMARFWDVSEKRAKGLSFVARELGTIAPDVAYNFGLFCDIGIPLLRGQLNTYQETLSAANRTAAGRFLQIEENRHGINHASVGALLAERWEISAHITQAIQAHHNPEILRQQAFLSPSIRSLVASNLLVEKAIEQFRGEKTSLEWRVGGPFAAVALGMTEADITEFTGRLVHQFSRQE